METEYKQIKSVAELQALFADTDSNGQFFVQLNFGCRSWKQIFYNKESDYYFVCNEIDESEEEYNSTAEFEKSEIAEYIRKGALYFAWF